QIKVDKWRESAARWYRARSEDPDYRRAALEFVCLQNRQPQFLRTFEQPPSSFARWYFKQPHQSRAALIGFDLWCYKSKVIGFVGSGPEPLRDRDHEALLIKQFVLRREQSAAKLRRETEVLENLERLATTPREAIPGSVRLFVWQRDKGQCVKCGSRGKLEF